MAMLNLVRWTRDQVLALPSDGNRYELFDGELVVTPSPAARHQMVNSFLLVRMGPFLEGNRTGWLLISPADLLLDGSQVAQPDLFVLPRVPFSTWETAPLPLLAIEVLSPSTARYDRAFKRRYYQRAGVAEFWVVDADAELVERWRPGDERPEILDREVTWQPAPGVAPLTIDLPALFGEVRDATSGPASPS